MSGGVDSSVSAWLLKQAGYQVEGLFMKNWEEDDTESYCSSAADLSDVQSVCERLNIKLHTVNFSFEYWNKVFMVFLEECRLGRTPNPDILCNKEIKFNVFLKFAIEHLQANYIATGHYVRCVSYNKKIYLLRGLDISKDQSYFLYTLNYDQLRYCLFPMGTFTKLQVRAIANHLHFVTADKKNSTGICFIGKRNFKNFIGQYLSVKPGIILSIDGVTLGKHDGLIYYTLGQRKGLGIGGTSRGNGKPWHVVDKNSKNNTLIVAQGGEHPALLSKGLIANQLYWVNDSFFFGKSSLFCTVKIRYRQSDIPCLVMLLSKNEIKVVFKHPVLSVTPGQSAVFYLNEYCLGGGVIKARIPLYVRV